MSSRSLSLCAGLRLSTRIAFSLLASILGSAPWPFPRSSTVPSSTARLNSSLSMSASSAAFIASSSSIVMSLFFLGIFGGVSSPRSSRFQLQRMARLGPSP